MDEQTASHAEALNWVPSKRPRRLTQILKWMSRDTAGAFGLIVVVIIVFAALFPQLLTNTSPTHQSLMLLRQPPSRAHPFGMDELGRDILSRIIYGARYTLGVGCLSVMIGVIIGVPIGLISGFRGGLLDTLLMRTIDALLSFPYFLIAVMLVAATGASVGTAVISVGVTMIPSFARVVRGSVLSMKNSEYVLSAASLGCSTARVLRVHVLPNVLAPLTVLATLNMATGVLAVAGLGFLGLGLQPPTPEWGLMLSNAKSAMTVAPHVMIFPGIAIVLLVTAFNLLGDGLRELFDPRMRGV